MLKYVTIIEARNGLADIINEVAYAKDQYCISRYNQNLVVMIDMETWKRLSKLDKEIKIIESNVDKGTHLV